jgi:hypothetical protein
VFQELIELFRQRLAERQRDVIGQSGDSSSFVLICMAWFWAYTATIQQDRANANRRCIESRDEGYERCTETRESRSSSCCDWVPCSWGCAAIVWIVDTICVASVWVKNVVCTAWAEGVFNAKFLLAGLATGGCMLWMLFFDIVFSLIVGIVRLIR